MQETLFWIVIPVNGGALAARMAGINQVLENTSNVKESIWMIAKLFVPISRKRPVFEQMCDDFIYSKVFAAAGKKDWDLKLMQRRQFLPIFLIDYCLGAARAVYRQIKRIRLAKFAKEAAV